MQYSKFSEAIIKHFIRNRGKCFIKFYLLLLYHLSVFRHVRANSNLVSMSWVTKFGTVLFGSTIPYFSYRHPDVKEALAGQRPVVALESNIITHGMPYLHNLRLKNMINLLQCCQTLIMLNFSLKSF